MNGITDEMVETALMAAMRFGSAQDDARPVDDRYLREQMRAALTGALAGRAVVDLPEPGRLPFDARDRIERTLRAYEGHTIPEVAHRLMLALTQSGVAGGVL